MDRLILDTIKKNPRFDIIIRGNKDAKPFLAKLKLLCNLNYIDYINLINYKAGKDDVIHIVISKDILEDVADDLNSFNPTVLMYFKNPCFCFDFTGVSSDEFYLMYSKIRSVLKEPTFLVNTDREDFRRFIKLYS